MKKIFSYLTALLVIASCSETNTLEDQEYTGRVISYELQQASEFPTSGDVTFKERSDKSVEIIVTLSGTEGEIHHPVHLHSDNISTPDAPIAVLLNDLYGKTGISTTIISKLADEKTFQFDDVEQYFGSVKIHLSSYGDGRDVVLAGGNIGLAIGKEQSINGRIKIAVCQSE
jgi:hypothetical protein